MLCIGRPICRECGNEYLIIIYYIVIDKELGKYVQIESACITAFERQEKWNYRWELGRGTTASPILTVRDTNYEMKPSVLDIDGELIYFSSIQIITTPDEQENYSLDGLALPMRVLRVKRLIKSKFQVNGSKELQKIHKGTY